jgi:hypothetical protein
MKAVRRLPTGHLREGRTPAIGMVKTAAHFWKLGDGAFRSRAKPVDQMKGDFAHLAVGREAGRCETICVGRKTRRLKIFQ